jgi:glycosyltransferase involved in cell wall biosynthesis
MATYNGAQWLREQLDSIEDQTRPPDELVISDDASSDATVEVLRQFADSAPFPVIVLTGERLGFVRNFERALTRCSGDIAFLSDQDDRWAPHKIETILGALRPEAAMAFHNAFYTDAEGRTQGPTMFERFRMAGIVPEGSAKGCCTAVRRSVLANALPMPEVPAHDVWLHRVARVLGPVTYVDEPLIYYRIHSSNVSAASPFTRLRPVRRSIVASGKFRTRKLVKRPSTPQLQSEMKASARLATIAAAAGNKSRSDALRAEVDALARRVKRRQSLRMLTTRLPL